MEASSIQTVCLVSKDGSRFALSADAAKLSGTLKTLLEADQSGRTSIDVPLPDFEIETCQRVVEFLKYKYDTLGKVNAAEFEISQEESLNLMLAANYLQC
eukprot:GCRY01001081.1.p1 GENE.GCRY01001081.1~~GCRY01001081.1.p1  ORF type:complete len:100 (-),score=11.70 GCRY01001081.1:142-441(-)